MNKNKKILLSSVILATIFLIPALELFANGPTFFMSYNFTNLEIIFFYIFLLFLFSSIFYSITRFLTWFDKSQTLVATEQSFISLILTYVITQELNRLFLLNKVQYVIVFIISFFVFKIFLSRINYYNLIPAFSLFPIIYLGLTLLSSPIQAIFTPAQDIKKIEISDEYQHNIFLVIIDEIALGPLLDKNLDVNNALFPNFSRLQESSTWYRETKTVASNTLFAAPAIFTGLYPQGVHADPTASNYPLSVFTALANNFEIRSFEPYTRVCPIKICARPGFETSENVTGLNEILKSQFTRYRYFIIDVFAVLGNMLTPPSFAKLYFPDLDGKWFDFYGVQTKDSLTINSPVQRTLQNLGIGAEDQAEWKKLSGDLRTEFPEAIKLIEPTDNRTFWMIHWVPPHGHDRSPDGSMYYRSLPYEMSYETSNANLEILRRQQYILQTIYIDSILGDFIDKLEKESLWDESLVIVTSDHGMNFARGDRRGRNFRSDANQDMLSTHSLELIDTLPVPLFIKYPNQSESRIVSEVVTIVDIFPTILYSLGVGYDEIWEMEGKPLQLLSGDRKIFWHHVGDFLDKYGIDYLASDARDRNLEYLGDLGNKENLYLNQNPRLGEKIHSLNYVDSTATFKVHKLREMQNGEKKAKSNLELFEAEADALVGLKKDSYALIGINSLVCGKGPVYKDVSGIVRVEAMLYPSCIRNGEYNSIELYLNLNGDNFISTRIVNPD